MSSGAGGLFSRVRARCIVACALINQLTHPGRRVGVQGFCVIIQVRHAPGFAEYTARTFTPASAAVLPPLRFSSLVVPSAMGNCTFSPLFGAAGTAGTAVTAPAVPLVAATSLACAASSWRGCSLQQNTKPELIQIQRGICTERNIGEIVGRAASCGSRSVARAGLVVFYCSRLGCSTTGHSCRHCTKNGASRQYSDNTALRRLVVKP